MYETFERRGGLVRRRLTIGEHEHLTSLNDRADRHIPPRAAWWQSALRGERIIEQPTAKPIRVVDAFCGAGGLALGVAAAAEAVGRFADFVAIVDRDELALRVHSANTGARRQLNAGVSSLVDYHVSGSGDAVRFAYPPELLTDQLREVLPVDLFVAGPPCEGHSNLNNHTRRDDPRNRLYVTSVALGVALHAKSIVIENVPTVLRDKSGVVDQARTLLEQEGYRVSTLVLKADQLGGAQRRSRFFLLADRHSRAAPDFLAAAAIALAAPAASVEWAIDDLLDVEAQSLMDTPTAVTEPNRRRIDFLFDNDLHDLPNPERPDCHKEGTTYLSVYGRMRWDEPSQTITTGFNTPGQGRYVHPLRRRVITPREAARLQGFPDWFNFIPPGLDVRRKHLAKWIGDAVPPLLGYAVGLAALSSFLTKESSNERFLTAA